MEADWVDGFHLRYRQGLAAPVFHHVEWLACERGGLAVSGRRVELVLPGRRLRRLRRLRGRGRWKAERRLLDVLLDGDEASRREFSAAENLGTVGCVEAAARSLRLGREVALDEVMLATHEEVRGG